MAVSEDEKNAEQAMSTAKITNSTQMGNSLKEVVSRCVRVIYSTASAGFCHIAKELRIKFQIFRI